jgi:uncharacterized protein
MSSFIELIRQPWHWYVSGPLIGLTVPALLLLGNKPFGISANLRHICAMCFPANIPFFKYDWKKELWNLFLVAGVLLGGIISTWLLSNPDPIQVSPALAAELSRYGIHNHQSQVPSELFSWGQLFTLRGLLMMVGGGFLIGFGTRYAGGCTSGHAITGLSMLQWPSLVATVCFMVGGLVMANFILPIILSL